MDTDRGLRSCAALQDARKLCVKTLCGGFLVAWSDGFLLPAMMACQRWWLKKTFRGWVSLRQALH